MEPAASTEGTLQVPAPLSPRNTLHHRGGAQCHQKEGALTSLLFSGLIQVPQGHSSKPSPAPGAEVFG